MGMPFAMGVVTAIVAFSHLLVGRIEIARLRSELAERDAEREMRGGND
jgi:hypothetical protein